MENLKVVGKFVLHIVVGVTLFLTMACAAIVLNLFSEWTTSIRTPEYITYPLHLLEYFVFCLDVICFLAFCLAETHILIREIASSAGWVGGGSASG
jgi:hypothetical protein